MIGDLFKPIRPLQILLSCLIPMCLILRLLSAMKIGMGVELWPLAEAVLILITSIILGVALSGDLNELSGKIQTLLLWASGCAFVSFLIWLTINPFVDLMSLSSMIKLHFFLLILSLASGSLGLMVGLFFDEPVYGAGAALIIAALFMSAVFWVNFLLGGSSGHSQLLIKFAIDSNPVIVVSSLLGGDPMHTKYLYEISEVSFYRFRYPRIHVIAIEYIGAFLILCSLATIKRLSAGRRQRRFLKS